MSPSINDPSAVVTGIGCLRTILERLTEHASEPAMREPPDAALTMVVRPRELVEHLASPLQIGRDVDGGARVVGETLLALRACAAAARDSGAHERLEVIRGVTATIAAQARLATKRQRDRVRIQELAALTGRTG